MSINNVNSSNVRLDLSFFDIQDLDVSSDVKDELTLAFLHGLDLTGFVGERQVTFEVLRGIRLCLEHEVPSSYINSNLDADFLKSISLLYSTMRTLETSNLSKYFDARTSACLIEYETFSKLVTLTLKDLDFNTVDFMKIPIGQVDLFISGIYQKLPLDDLVDLAVYRERSYIELLMNLRFSGISIEPFLDGQWTEEQVETLIFTNSKYPTSELIANYVNEKFTSGQIEQVLKAIEYSCVDTVAQLDSDGYPLFNEYQMWNIVEGARFGLDYKTYANPNYNDATMSNMRNQLLDVQDRMNNGKLKSQLYVGKAIRLN